MRRQTQPRYFTANRTAKFNCIQGFFDVQFPGPPLSIHAAIIVNAIRQVGVFLNFAEHHTWPNRVGRACWHEKCVAGLHAPVNKHFLELLTFDGVHKLVSVGFGNKSDEYMRSEEHTSELQSPDHLVCRLLLEKKKKKTNKIKYKTSYTS